MAKKKKRPRSQRREAERAAARKRAKLNRDLDKLEAAEAGASRQNPIIVASMSLIDGAIRGLLCLACGGQHTIAGEQGNVHAGRVMRSVQLKCRQCGREREAHFALKILN